MPVDANQLLKAARKALAAPRKAPSGPALRKDLWQACTPAADLMLSKGRSLVEVTDFLMVQAKEKPVHKTVMWWRFYNFVQRRQRRLAKARQDAPSQS